MRTTLDKVLAMTESTSMSSQIKQMFGYEPEGSLDDDDEEVAYEEVDAGLGDMELQLDSNKSGFGSQIKLQDGQESGFGSGSKGPGFGGGGLKLDLNLGN